MNAAAPAKVLIVGWRVGIGRALEALGVPFAVWNVKAVKRRMPGVIVRVQPYGNTPERSRSLAEAFEGDGPFTHVIAGTEDAVVAASYARRVLGARASEHTTAQRCHDKLFMKKTLLAQGIPMTPFIDGNRHPEPEVVIEALHSPVVIKDRKSSGGRGVEIAHTEEEVARSPLRNRLIERFVDAPEISVESFVTDGKVRFENVTRYQEKKHVNVVPGTFEPERLAQILALSRRVIAALRIRWGMTHLEFYMTDDEILFGEIALRPPGGYIMEAMANAYGFDPWMAFVRTELDLPLDLPQSAENFAAAIVLHPGAGRVVDLFGVERVRNNPHVTRFELKVAVGDVISDRVGLGNDVGYLLLKAPTREALLASVREIRQSLGIIVAPE